MFNWLDNLLWQRQRMIYRYRDGVTVRRGDPLVIYRTLKNHKEFDYDSHLTGHDNGDEKATAACVLGTREAFGIPEFNQTEGLTENELIALLKHFTLYVLELKKNSSPPPILSKPTAMELPDCLPCQEQNGTLPTADSTSTFAEPNSATQEVSQKELMQPST